jgi:hypothetical protein
VDSEAEARAEAEVEARVARASVPLPRALHRAAMTEVVLDWTGHAALTLDADGGVRLWPDLQADDVGLPVALPLSEPTWLSLSRVGEGFAVAWVDTAGAASVARVTFRGAQARFTEILTLPPTEPTFELYVLRGGTRILSLGVDHRVHLWDATGEHLATLDNPGFVPWQLRVAEVAGDAPTVLAVLAGPVRVQPVLLTDDDALKLGDQIHPVALDRGPNRNDLALSPDGRTVLALQGPKARSTRFEIETIDVASGDRRILAADTDARGRPRLHALAGGRALLETGSGQGLTIDLAAATAWPPADGPADREALVPVTPTTSALAGSTPRTRMHASVVAGLRVVPSAEGLVVDALDTTGHRTVATQAFDVRAVALDATGQRVAWGTPALLWIEPSDGSASPTSIEGGAAGLVAFAGPDHLVAMSPEGDARIVHVDDGRVVGDGHIAVPWGLANVAWRTTDGAQGEIVAASLKPSEPLHVLAASAAGFGDASLVPRGERAQWPEAGKPRNMSSREWLDAIGLDYDALRLREAKVVLSEPDPTGRYVAIAQETRHNEGFDVEADAWVVGPHDYVVTVWDRTEGTRRWTQAAPALADVAWSADGTRIALAYAGTGLVLEAATGVTVLQRHDLGLHVVTSP